MFGPDASAPANMYMVRRIHTAGYMMGRNILKSSNFYPALPGTGLIRSPATPIQGVFNSFTLKRFF
jgi:hypothetical protein